jgi:hypothetical protein
VLSLVPTNILNHVPGQESNIVLMDELSGLDDKLLVMCAPDLEATSLAYRRAACGLL